MKVSTPTLVMSLILTAFGAAAQQPQTLRLTYEQHQVIDRHILQEARPNVAMPPELVPGIGAKMPDSVVLFWMPPSAGLNRYRYAVVNQHVFVVGYEDRRVIDIVAGPSERP